MAFTRFLLLFAGMIGMVSAPAKAGFLVILDENPFNGGERGFYRFDVDSRDLTFLSEVAYPSDRFEGLGADSHGRLFAGSEFGRLWRFNVNTGKHYLVGQVPVDVPSNQSKFVRGLTFNPTNDELLGFGFGPRLYQIDSSDASAVELAVIPSLDQTMTFLPDGRLLTITDTRRLAYIDTTTWQVSAINDATMPEINEIDATPDGRVFGVNWQNAVVYEIDPDTAAVEELARFGEEHHNGFISIAYVPEPSSAALAIVLTFPLVLRGISRLCRRDSIG